jgi:hypothetical protein
MAQGFPRCLESSPRLPQNQNPAISPVNTHCRSVAARVMVYELTLPAHALRLTGSPPMRVLRRSTHLHPRQRKRVSDACVGVCRMAWRDMVGRATVPHRRSGQDGTMALDPWAQREIDRGPRYISVTVRNPRFSDSSLKLGLYPYIPRHPRRPCPAGLN